MRKIILFCVSLFIYHCIYAQRPQYVRCVNMVDQEKYLESKDPTRKARREAAENEMNQWIANQSLHRVANVETQYTIPIVFHVVYNNPGEVITIQQIRRQVEVFNKDYNRLNTDASHTPGAFLPAAANFHITFCLASQ